MEIRAFELSPLSALHFLLPQKEVYVTTDIFGGVNEWQKEVYFRQKDNRNTSNISKLENAAIYVLFTRMFIFSSFVRKLCVPIL